MIDLIGQIRHWLANWFTHEPTIEPRPGPKPSPGPPIEPIPIAPSPESSVVAAIHAERTSKGLPVLVEDATLAGLATSWAASMAGSVGLEHGDFASRISSAYPNVAAAENIAEGQPDAKSVVDAWMQDPPHRENILGDFNRIGVGLDRDEAGSVFWCADFAKID